MRHHSTVVAVLSCTSVSIIFRSMCQKYSHYLKRKVHSKAVNIFDTSAQKLCILKMYGLDRINSNEHTTITSTIGFCMWLILYSISNSIMLLYHQLNQFSSSYLVICRNGVSMVKISRDVPWKFISRRKLVDTFIILVDNYREKIAKFKKLRNKLQKWYNDTNVQV